MTPSATFACPTCGRAFQWQPKLAGKQAKCICGEYVSVPDTDPSKITSRPRAEPKYVEELATPPARSAPAVSTVDDAQTNPAGSTPNMPEIRSYNLARAAARSPIKREFDKSTVVVEEEEVEETDAEREAEAKKMRITGVYIPIAMCFVGIASSFLLWIKMSDSTGQALAGASVMLAFQLILFVPLSITAAILTAKWLDVGFGPAVPAAAKLAAITLGPGAIADGLLFFLFHQEFDYQYVLVGFVIYMFLCGVPALIMFRLALPEMALLVSIMVMPRIALLFGSAAAFPKLFGL